MNKSIWKSLFQIILVVSSVSCWMMFAYTGIMFISGAAMGAVIGIILCRLYSGSKHHVSRINIIISVIVALTICYCLAVSFYQKWIPAGGVAAAAGLLSLDAASFLKILSFGMALAAFPSVVYSLTNVSKIGRWFSYCRHLVDVKKVWEMMVSSVSVKSLLSIILNVVGASVLGTLLLIGVYSLPITTPP